MKFTSVLVVLPVFAQYALFTSAHPFAREENGKGVNERGNQNNNERGNNNNRGGGFGGNFGGNNNNQPPKGGQKTTTTAAKAKATTTTKAATTTAKAVSTTAAAKTTAKATTTTTTAALVGATGISDAGTGNGGGGSGNLQTSLTLDPALIGSNLAHTGNGANPEAGQVDSLTSTNNYINFCAGVNQPITNGEQVIGGSCNPVPMGQIPAKTQIPSCKFTFPANFGTIPANQNFTVLLAQNNLETGNFVNATANYYSAPQQLNSGGTIIGHNHIVMQQLTSITSATVLDATVFTFFKGVNQAAVNGVLSVPVVGGVPAGAYRMCSISTDANHAPVLAPVAQHGQSDDCIYYTAK